MHNEGQSVVVPIELGERVAGPGCPSLVIAEVAQAHDGSLGAAHAFIDAIADAGADAVKFQTHIASAESTPSEPFRVAFSRQDATRYDYWKRMEFSEEQWAGLAAHANARGLLFLSSPFSPEAVELLRRIGVPAWKVASGEVGNSDLLDHLAATKLPVLLSSGLSSLGELDAAVARVKRMESPLAVLQCTSQYPCPPEAIGINLIAELAQRYNCPVGLSDHSGTIYPSFAAVALGASLIEVHVTLSRKAFGPDVAASITDSELLQLVEGVRFIDQMLLNPLKKDESAGKLAEVRRLFTRSVVVRQDLKEGSLLRAEHLIAKKPGTGIPASRLRELVGRRLVRDVSTDHLLTHEDVDPPLTIEPDWMP